MSAAPGNDSLGNVFKSDAKDSVPRISPDQNDTAVITGRWSFRKMDIALSSFMIKLVKGLAPPSPKKQC